MIRPYVTGEDIATDPRQAARRWVIDFGQRTLDAAARYPLALEIVRKRVKPEREESRDRYRRRHWWLFGRPYTAVRDAMSPLGRYSAANRVGKRLLIAWFDRWVAPSDKAQVFAFDDDYSMRVLTSRGHGAWAWARGATLKADLSYTPTSVFETFAWPDPTTGGQREDVADACRRLLTRRTEICAAEQIGLTTLYNAMDDGAWADLNALHRDLDVAVAACYGWPASVAQDDAELVRRLKALNREITEGTRPYAPFAHLEVPTD